MVPGNDKSVFVVNITKASKDNGGRRLSGKRNQFNKHAKQERNETKPQP